MLEFRNNIELITNNIASYGKKAVTSCKRQKKDKSIRYYEIPCAFDIETTSATTEEDEKLAWMYEWTFAFGESLVIYGRTWNEYIELTNILKDKLKLNKYKRLYIGVQNLAFEFQFIRKYFNWDYVFANDDRHPIQAVNDGLDYHCTATISGYDLEHMAENLTSHNIKKLKGNLDYNLIRCSETPLSDEELEYCYNDVMIIIYYLLEQRSLYGSIKDIPLTNTARVREYCRYNTLYVDNSYGKRSFNYSYKEIMNELKLTPKLYYSCKAAFRGGYVHANPKYINKECDNISSYDLTSAYLYEMIANKYPMSEFVRDIPKNKTCFNWKINNYACLMLVEFENIKCNSVDSYISWLPNKMDGLNINNNNNGRIISADKLKLWITEIDYKIIAKTYTWDSIAFYDMYIAKKDYLPKELIKCVLELYKNKTTYKDDPEHKIEYMNAKALANSVYGCMVQDIGKITNAYSDDKGWYPDYPSMDDRINIYNNSKNRFIYYPWGVWVSAYCRYTLWHGILECGEDYRYSDTDSVKFANRIDHEWWFDDYNYKMLEKAEACLKHYGIDKDYLCPCTAQGEVKPLGVWEYEGTYDKFKTLGAKKYIYTKDGKTEIAVAGLGKQAVNYIIEQSPKNPLAIFDEFLAIPAEHTGKLTHTFIDEPIEGECEDYLGNRCSISQLSGIHLEACPYSFSIEDQFMEWLLDNEIYGGY